ncbi:hypothetical protein [Aquamicrobium zhengzhouense]|uniref:Uncharacterized protein n=1 Tax=Aquamicrobium zhengzhouense TaxID=2781738 RepID=A0ABS0SAB1_9HYPH|nr:hypothetical protein [Aquamicrobium zhengzhouense]MBI1620161.1 hypothetical protein [Aquamicrobium zhengzhouense]
MSAYVLTSLGRAVMAEALAALPFVVALSAGDPDWDDAWGEVNPPTPSLGANGILALVGYVRPTIVGFVVEDPEGIIVTDEGTKYSTSEARTRNLRIRIQIPAGSWTGATIREIGVFANASFDAGMPAGKTVLDEGDVIAAGDLLHLSWLRPQFLSAGTSLIRDFILRV